MALSHPSGSGAPQRLRVAEPSLLLYPRPLAHDFHNAPVEGSDFSCAQLEFADAERHPLASALPPFVCVPLRETEYPTRWRLLLAQQRLRSGAALKSLATELGYANPSALSRVFKAQMGCAVRKRLGAA